MRLFEECAVPLRLCCGMYDVAIFHTVNRTGDKGDVWGMELHSIIMGRDGGKVAS